MLMHLIHLVLSYGTLSNEIFCVHFWSKIMYCCFCAFHSSEMNFILQPQKEKSCRRQAQCLTTLCGCCCVVLCIPFIWDILLFIPDQNLAQQRNEIQNIPISAGRLEHRIDPLSSLGHITCEWKASSSQPTIILDVIAVYPCFQKYLIKIVTVGWKIFPHQFGQEHPHKP